MSGMKERLLQPSLPQSLIRDIDRPSLQSLSYALRHPETWPDDFVWDYGSCDQCAGALARRLWPNHVPEMNCADGATVMARTFEMSYTKARDIFMGCAFYASNSVTPDMVAYVIDQYIEGAN